MAKNSITSFVEFKDRPGLYYEAGGDIEKTYTWQDIYNLNRGGTITDFTVRVGQQPITLRFCWNQEAKVVYGSSNQPTQYERTK